MSLFMLFIKFLMIGLFTVGGGLAAIPLMIQSVVDTGLISEPLFYNMIAISESTPGPIGINLATYIGFVQYGVIGAVLLSLAISLPCFCISFGVSKILTQFQNAKVVNYAFYGIRACVTGLIATATFSVLKLGLGFNVGLDIAKILDWKAVVLFAALSILYVKYKKQPSFYILISALVGVLIF